MSAPLNSYLADGACPQARAVLALVSGDADLISEDESANPSVARFENCREQGYVISMPDKAHRKQINVMFFEHRNSDDIVIIKWVGTPTINTPTLANVPEDHPWRESKYYNDGSFAHGEILPAATYILKLLEDFLE